MYDRRGKGWWWWCVWVCGCGYVCVAFVYQELVSIYSQSMALFTLSSERRKQIGANWRQISQERRRRTKWEIMVETYFPVKFQMPSDV